MARPRQLALVLLCGTVTLAGWCAARLGGFEWSDIEDTAMPIWNRGAARGATISSVAPALAAVRQRPCVGRPCCRRGRGPSQAARACRRARGRTAAGRTVDPAAANLPRLAGVRRRGPSSRPRCPTRIRRHRPKHACGSCPCSGPIGGGGPAAGHAPG